MADLRLKHLEDQLKKIGCNFQFWGRSEIKELANILLPGETVEHVVNGTYDGGFAMLAATDQRVLLIDKKPMYLTLEDVRFDMIAEIDYNHRLMNATVFIFTPSKSLKFTGYNQARLRKLFQFVQTRVMEIRQHYTMQAQQPPVQGGSVGVAASFGTEQAQQPPNNSALAAQAGRDQNIVSAPPREIGNYMAGTSQTDIISAAPAQPKLQYARQAPVITAYTRLPMRSRQRRFLGARAVNDQASSIFQQ